MIKEMKKGDWILISLVLLAVAAIMINFYMSKTGTAYSSAQIYQNGELVKELSLNQNTEFDILGNYTNHVTVQDGMIAITTSDCPGNDCVHMGWLMEGKQSIVCLPNKVEIRLLVESEVDFVVQ